MPHYAVLLVASDFASHFKPIECEGGCIKRILKPYLRLPARVQIMKRCNEGLIKSDWKISLSIVTDEATHIFLDFQEMLMHED